MKKYLSLLIAFLFGINTIQAKKVDVNYARQIGFNFIKKCNPDKASATCDLQLSATYQTSKGIPALYIFNYENGFVIVSADDRAIPILAYSTDTFFETENIPDNINYWLNGYTDEIQAITESYREPDEAVSAQWNELFSGCTTSPKSVVITPLISTKWDQDEPFNNLCPTNCVSGCVATAMAQILKYWEYPIHGSGSHTYTYGGITHSVNFGNTTYDWSNMIDIYGASYTTQQASAVATLMYHCGVAVNMMYGTAASGGSGAYSSDVPAALRSYFGYASTTSMKYKSSYNDTQWKNLIKTELNAYRPLYYSGSGSTGGHAFVCDGYDSDDYFHFNWGWTGYCDGYYVIGSLNPGSGGTGSGNGTYNLNNAVIVIQPTSSSLSAPTNLTATVNERNVSLSWTASSGASSYKVYRNNKLIASNVTGTSYNDNNLCYGNYYYFVKAVSSSTTSDHSNIVTASVIYPGPVPSNLTGSASGPNAMLAWTAPSSGSGQLYYATSSAGYSVGIDNTTFYFGQRYLPEQLIQYAGMGVNKVSVYFSNTGTYQLYLCQGEDLPSTVLYNTSVSVTSMGWKDINLTNAAYVDCAVPLWIYVIAPSNISYPATYGNYTQSEEGNYYSTNGYGWSHYSGASWLMKVFFQTPTYSYKVYRNNSLIANNVSSSSYTDPNLSPGAYSYHVTTNYFGRESSPSNTVTVTINDTEYFTISTSSNPSNGGTTSGGGTFAQGESCTVTASANTGYTFVNWTENGTQVSANASYSFTVTSNRNLVANFSQITYNVATSSNPSDGGTTSGGGTFAQGESCTVTASANTGYTFVNWTENGTQVSANTSYSFTVTSNRNLVANFSQITYNVATSSNPSNGGTTSGGGTFAQGESCTVTASANTGYTFVNWTENGTQVSANASYSFTVTSNRNLVANFSLQTVSITASVDPAESGTISGTGDYNYGQTVTLSVTPNNNYVFLNWTEDGNIVSESNPYTFTAQTSRTLVAHFEFVNGIEEIADNIKVFPNPADDFVYIKCNGININKVEIYNVMGQLLISHEVEDDSTIRIDINEILSSGSLLLQIYTESGIITKQIIKK